MIRHTLNIFYTEHTTVEELEPAEIQLLKSAWDASRSAYAPYSGFHVGAAVLLENNEIITGNNQENAAYPSGLCAERVAVFAASSRFPGIAVRSIAVVASAENSGDVNPVTPCGSCRQVLAEYETLTGKPIRTLMQGTNGNIWVVEGINNLLPLMFQGEHLKK